MKNMMYKVLCAIFDLNWTNGLSSYTQASCQVTFNNNKYRIYRPPNISNLTTVLNYTYTGSVQSVSLTAGTYIIECWGAQGGGSNSSGNTNSGAGGKGGYTKGTISLPTSTTVYIRVGGVGSSSNTGKAEGGFNGGGSAWGSSSSEPGNGGGGASDVRIGTDNLYARVIVAGGGGGGGEDTSDIAGNAGSTSVTNGGTGTQAGSTFGQGAHTASDGGGGGGGWYGGNTAGGTSTPATTGSSSDTSGGGGGSGYVYTSAASSLYPSGCLLNSTYYLSDTLLLSGSESFLSPDGTTETGHSGAGHVRITTANTGNTMWGGLRIQNTNNLFGLIEGHTYIVLFDVEGLSSNAAVSVGWHEQMGWGHTEIRPNPTNVEYDWVGADFTGQKTCWYKCTISDSLYKTCYNATTNPAFVAGSTYLSYADFQFGFGYENTGSLGTDLYISNIRMYDITNNPKFEVKKSSITNAAGLIEGSNPLTINRGNEIVGNLIYEV